MTGDSRNCGSILCIRDSKRGFSGFGNKGIGKDLALDIVRLCCEALPCFFKCNHRREGYDLYTNQQRTANLFGSDETVSPEMIHAWYSVDCDG